MKHEHSLRGTHRGAGLIQVMVALTIGAIIATGLMEILISSKRTYRVQEAQARVQETGRFGTELLSYEVRMAGFMGCPNLDRVTPRVVANPAPATAFTNSTFIEAYEAGTSTWTPSLPTAMASATAGNDAISIHRGADCIASLSSGMTADNAALSLTSGHGCGFNAGDYLIISDCISADLFRASNVSSSGGIETVSHATSHNSEDRFSKQYSTDAVVMKLQETSFFIAPGAGGQPALWQSEDGDPAVELVDGIESLQILYGEDLDGDLSADRYVMPDTANFDVANVVGLRLHLLLQTLVDNVTLSNQTYTFAGTTTTATDGRLRRIFTTTVNLRNRTTN